MINLRKILENSLVADVEYHESIGSTNDRAIAAAGEAGVKLPLVIVADQQTAGRGRGSNRWWTGPGSLAFSLLLDGSKRQPQSLISLASGVAIVEALAPRALGHEIGIHWPNDVMLDGRKLAGVLIEVLPDGKQVIGIGINTNNSAADAPEEVRERVATLRDAAGESFDSTDLLISLLHCLEEVFTRLPAEIAARTNEICLQRGKQVILVSGGERIAGRCLGIAADGALLIEQGEKPRAVYSGTVADA